MKKKAIISIVVLVVLAVTATVVGWGLPNVFGYSRNADEIKKIYGVQVVDEGALQGATWYVAYRDDVSSYQPRITQNKDVAKYFYAAVNTISLESRDFVVERHVEKVDVSDAIEYDLGGNKIYYQDLTSSDDEYCSVKIYLAEYYVVRVPKVQESIEEIQTKYGKDIKQIIDAIL